MHGHHFGHTLQVSRDRELSQIIATREESRGTPRVKVLILATDLFSRGGIARYTSTLASCLGRMLGPGNVDVLCFFDWGFAGDLPTDFRVAGMISARKRAGVLSMLRFLWKAGRAGTRRYDLIIANHVALAPVAAMMKLIFRTPYWVSCHSVEIWWGTSKVRHAALKNAGLILPVSRYTADVIQKLDGIQSSRIKVVYNAIPDSFAKLLLSEEPLRDSIRNLGADRPLLLSVSSLVRGNEFKGLDTVIRALPRVLKTLPGVRYAIVGEGEIKPALERLAVEMGVAENVNFLGEVSDSELAELYRRCDAFVLPSRGQERQGEVGGEGFGRVYVEAALAGKPVVGSRAGGASEAVLDGTTGFLLNPLSIDDPPLAARMGSAGRSWSLDNFSEHALSKSLKELLRRFDAENEKLPNLEHAGGRR